MFQPEVEMQHRRVMLLNDKSMSILLLDARWFIGFLEITLGFILFKQPLCFRLFRLRTESSGCNTIVLGQRVHRTYTV